MSPELQAALLDELQMLKEELDEIRWYLAGHANESVSANGIYNWYQFKRLGVEGEGGHYIIRDPIGSLW